MKKNIRNTVKKLKTRKKTVKPQKRVLVAKIKKNKTAKNRKIKIKNKLASGKYGTTPQSGGAFLRSKKTADRLKKTIYKKHEQAKKSAAKSKARKLKENRKKIKTKTPSLSAESFKPKIRVIGIGGGGGSIVSEIGRSLDKATFVIADTDVRAFKAKKKPGIKYFLFGQEATHGLGTGLNTDLAKEAAQREKEKISLFFKEQDIVIFISCLGGGLGSGATQVFLDAAQDFSGITFGIFTLPFKFEGKNKQKVAAKALKELRKSLNISLTMPNERIFKVINENTAITEAFSMVNKNLVESLESLINLIQSPGLINIDFADLRTILQGKGNLAFLNTAESSGKDRAEQVIKNVLYNPLYQDGFVPEKVLFNIEGGKGLNMFEVDKISRAIAEKNMKAKIIFGISKNPKYKNKIKTVLLMTGPAPSAKVGVKESKPKEVPLGKNASKTKPKIKKIKVKKEKLKVGKSEPAKEKTLALGDTLPVFYNPPVQALAVKKIDVSQKPESAKKTIRRTALEIQKVEEMEKDKKSKQEKEWEIPAFLRFKKVK